MKRAAALILALVLCLALCSVAASAEESATITVAVDGTYASPDISAVLERVNAIRYEAYTDGLVDEYFEVKWSSGLEEIAQLRAAETCIDFSHTRPNGMTWYNTVSSNGTTTGAENLATAAMLYSIELFYSEKADYVAGTEGAVTGHYTSMINPDYTSIGLGTFTSASGSTRTAMEFSYASGDGVSTGVSGSTTVSVEIIATALNVSGTSTLTVDDETTLAVTAAYSGTEYSVVDDVAWSSSDETVATVDENGIVTAVSAGSATITATMGTLSASLDVTVNAAVVTTEPTATPPAVTGIDPTQPTSTAAVETSEPTSTTGTETTDPTNTATETAEPASTTETEATTKPVSTSSAGTSATATPAATAVAPATGDSSALALWVTLTALCTLGAAAVIGTLRKKEN